MTDEAYEKRQEALKEVNDNALFLVAVSYGPTPESMRIQAIVNKERIRDQEDDGVTDMQFFTAFAAGLAQIAMDNASELASYGIRLAADEMGDPPSNSVN